MSVSFLTAPNPLLEALLLFQGQNQVHSLLGLDLTLLKPLSNYLDSTTICEEHKIGQMLILQKNLVQFQKWACVSC